MVEISESAYCMDNNIIDWLMNDCSWAYWSYTREIINKVFNNDSGWDNIVFTNAVKCTNVDGDGAADKSTDLMKHQCIDNLNVIFDEIRLAKPKHIVFYTYDFCGANLLSFPFSLGDEAITSRNTKILCGQKKLGWWTRKLKTTWGTVHVLVTNHPERKKKDEYINSIVDWVKSTN